jgi:hypothetical protein
MRIVTTIRDHLTYANVAASLAVVLALGGTAYAAGLPKNSVASKQIKNGTVTTKDVKDGGLRGADLGVNSIRGTQVDESGLSTVPTAATAANAAALGGLPASGYQRIPVTANGPFTASVPLLAIVNGYGTYRLVCDTGGSPLDDDVPRVGFQSDLGAGASVIATLEAAPAAGEDGVVRINSGLTGTSTSVYSFSDDRLAFDLFFESADHGRVIHVSGAAYDNTATAACSGVISAEVLK